MTRYTNRITMLFITLVAFALRVWQLDSIPPGWRDDELINSLVISQKVLDGIWAVYYADASGHEALYHVLNALMLGLFGPNIIGIRYLSVILGTLTVPLTYVLGRKLFHAHVGLIAAAALAVSFWSLMYSRTGIRHILMPLTTLAAFTFFWQAAQLTTNNWQFALSNANLANHNTHWASSGYWTLLHHWALSAIFVSLGFYTYFASRGVPLILGAFCLYVSLLNWRWLKRAWRGLLLFWGLTVVLALPLLFTLQQQPESEARVAELAVPLVEAQAGNFEPLRQHIIITLSMFHNDGDDEWLYNIPHRPVFGLIGAGFFWGGLLLCMGLTIKDIRLTFDDWLGRQRVRRLRPPTGVAAAFLLAWWLAGISPGFISVPPASLGHTILAQPATFLIAALPIHWFAQQLSDMRSKRLSVLLFGLLLVGNGAWRDLPAYFNEWPQRGMVRFLYRADIGDVADYLRANPQQQEVGITGLLAGPWDKLALDVELGGQTAVSPRWYNPERALLLSPNISFTGFPAVETPYTDAFTRVPDVDGIGGYRLHQVSLDLPQHAPICFENGLCNVTALYDAAQQRLTLGWQVQRPLTLPQFNLISNPPPPGVYAGPRLLVFGQLLDDKGNFLIGDDGLWVDAYTLQQGDHFVQQHWLTSPNSHQAKTTVFGLYDPMIGQRILTEDGRDSITLELDD